MSEIFETVKVAVRFHPISGEDIKNGVRSCLEKYVPPTNSEDESEENHQKRTGVISKHPDFDGRVVFHECDEVFEELSTNNEVYIPFVEPLVKKFCAGFNCCLLSAGIRGTGKSDLMNGRIQDEDSKYVSEEKGLIMLAVEKIFDELVNSAENFDFEVICSFWDMNDSKILDLLKPEDKNHRILRNENNERIIKDMTEINLERFEDFQELFDHGIHVSKTFGEERKIKWNSFLKLKLIRIEKKKDISDLNPPKKIKQTFVFVNLRGTHRFGALGARKTVLKEGGKINNSISSFSRMIHNIVNYCEKRFQPKKNEKQESEQQIIKKLPFELNSIFCDSKLTSLCSDFFGGKYYTNLICSVSGHPDDYKQTTSVLNNLTEARFIPLFPKIDFLKTKESALFDKIAKLEKKLPKNDPLAPGHPPTEEQETLFKLKRELREIMTLGFTTEDEFEKFVIKIPERNIPKDGEKRIWKKNTELSKKHGNRKLFLIPAKKKEKSFNEKWEKNGFDALKTKKSKKKFKSTYQGQWKNDKKEGYGIAETKTEKYEGCWKNNKKDGKLGVLWKKKKVELNSKRENTKKGNEKKKKDVLTRVYKGGWKKGKKHGFGNYYYKDGSIYSGDWKNDKRSGKGELYTIEGDKYVGEFKNDMKNGYGIIYYKKNQDIFKGNFLNDKKHGTGEFIYTQKAMIYKGEWEDDCPKCGEITEITG